MKFLKDIPGNVKALGFVSLFNDTASEMIYPLLPIFLTSVLGWLIYAVIYLGFGFSHSIWHIWLLFALYGIYFGFTEGVEKAFVSDLVVPEFHGTAFGFYHLAVGVASFPSSVIFVLSGKK